MEISQSRTQGPNNDIIDSFLDKLFDNYDTQYRFVLIKIQSKNKDVHESGRAFKQCMIGRGSDADYTIPGKDISRKHCIIYFKQDQLSVRDLYSRSGTFVNGVRIPPFEDFFLREQDVIQVSNDDQLIVQHITNVKMIDPAQPSSSMFPEHEVQCPYCTKQQLELPTQISEIMNLMQQIQGKLQTTRQDLETVTKQIEKSANTISHLEKEQKVIFVDQKALTFKKHKSVVAKSTVDDSKLKHEDLTLGDVNAPKKRRSWFLSSLWQKAEAATETKDDAAEQTNNQDENQEVSKSHPAKKSRLGRSRGRVSEEAVADGEVHDQETEVKTPRGLFSLFSRSKRPSASVAQPEGGTVEIGGVEKEDQERGEVQEPQDGQEKVSEEKSPRAKSPRSGLFARIFSPKSRAKVNAAGEAEEVTQQAGEVIEAREAAGEVGNNGESGAQE